MTYVWRKRRLKQERCGSLLRHSRFQDERIYTEIPHDPFQCNGTRCLFDITGKPMKNWVLVKPEGIEDDDQLKGWIQRAVKFVGKLPGKWLLPEKKQKN